MPRDRFLQILRYLHFVDNTHTKCWVCLWYAQVMSKVWLDIPISYPSHIKNIHMTYQELTLVWYARGRSVIYLCYLCYTKDIPLSIIFATNFIYQKGSQNIPLWKYLKHTLATCLKLCFGYVDHTSNIPINYQEHIKFDIPKTYQ